jgi:hypothetical protein
MFRRNLRQMRWRIVESGTKALKPITKLRPAPRAA